MNEAATEAAPSRITQSPVMAMMAMVTPTIMMSSASAPSVMMTATAPTHMAVTMTVAVATFDLNDSCIGTAKSTRRCGGHRRRRQGRS
jgi:hypothetical protein